MSINSVIKYPKPRPHYNRTIIAPCNPIDIKYCSTKKVYIVNYLLKTGHLLRAYRISFKSYADAYTQMNTARIQQGFQTLPPFKKYQGE
jgi:hypothetical protein